MAKNTTSPTTNGQKWITQGTSLDSVRRLVKSSVQITTHAPMKTYTIYPASNANTISTGSTGLLLSTTRHDKGHGGDLNRPNDRFRPVAHRDHEWLRDYRMTGVPEAAGIRGTTSKGLLFAEREVPPGPTEAIFATYVPGATVARTVANWL